MKEIYTLLEHKCDNKIPTLFCLFVFFFKRALHSLQNKENPHLVENNGASLEVEV